MNRTRFFVYPMVAALSLAAAFAAHAESPLAGQFAQPQAVSTTTRAQVIAEYHQAKRTGALKVSSTSYNPFADMKVTTTREAVKAEVLALNRSGHAHDMTGEDSGSFALAQARPVRAVPALTVASR